MPQADILAFRATLLLLPAVFLLGYYFFATVWVPRLLCTFKARAWLTQVQAVPLLWATNAWPEIFLMFVQFAGLVWVLSRVTLVAQVYPRLPTTVTPTPLSPQYTHLGGLPVENFFHLWTHQRQALFFAPGAVAVTHVVTHVLAGLPFYAPGKQFPFLLARLRQRLPTVVSGLPGGSRD